MIPEEFLNRMRGMLGSEFEEFFAGYDRPSDQALRINTLKADRQQFLQRSPFALQPVEWECNGFYYAACDLPGKHPYHEAGVYYIQEPSAMLPATLLDAQPGERVLDLCAAPGGKSTQIAAAMQGQGIFVSNEIHPARAKILSENIERMGITNAIVTNETPQKLTEHFRGYFDRIMVDAPCSGEGMFRKNEKALAEWNPSNVKMCAKRQDEILDCAADMLRPGGRMVYSTCTFAPEENEGSITRYLGRHSDFMIVKPEKTFEMSDGIADWWIGTPEEIKDTVRIWPHRAHGEGHFAAVLQKNGEVDINVKSHSLYGEERGLPEKDCKEYLTFQAESLNIRLNGSFVRFGEQLYLLPAEAPALKKLRVLRPGLHLGTMKKNRFEPSHALALALKPSDALHAVDLSVSEQEVFSYLNGQTFSIEGEKGWYLITADGYSLGWGKLAGGIMKNHYPKGLRWEHMKN